MNVRLTKEQKIRIANSDDVYTVMRAILMRQNRLHRQKEYFWTIGLNTASDILYIELISIGILNQANVDPVELFNFAVAKKCKRLILVHNHPAGTLKPTRTDVAFTQYVALSASILKIEILDHLIISEDGFYSMADHGHLK